MKIIKKIIAVIRHLSFINSIAKIKLYNLKQVIYNREKFYFEAEKEKKLKGLEEFIRNHRYYDFLQIDTNLLHNFNHNDIIVDYCNRVEIAGISIKDFDIYIFDNMEVTFDSRGRIFSLLANFTIPVKSPLMCNHLCIDFYFNEHDHSIDIYSFLNDLFIIDGHHYRADLYSPNQVLELIEFSYLDRNLVMEHLPEMFVPSAYDFTSESFNHRKQLVKILSY